MRRFVLIAGTLALLVAVSAQSASAGWLFGRRQSVRYYNYTPVYSNYTSVSSHRHDNASSSHDKRSSSHGQSAPWYVDRVDPLLEEQAWFSF